MEHFTLQIFCTYMLHEYRQQSRDYVVIHHGHKQVTVLSESVW